MRSLDRLTKDLAVRRIFAAYIRRIAALTASLCDYDDRKGLSYPSNSASLALLVSILQKTGCVLQNQNTKKKLFFTISIQFIFTLPLKKDNMNVKIKKLSENARIPEYASAGSAGADLYNASGEVTVGAGESVAIGTGIAMQIPEGYVGLVYARSGLACKSGLAPANKVGVIDSDYRGEIKVVLYNHSKEPRTVASGERIAQIVIAPFIRCSFEEGEIDSTQRGEGGFGSTGKK